MPFTTGSQACASCASNAVRGSAAGLIAAILTVVTLFALAGYQVTSEESGARMLGRVGAALIELDRWLPAHKDDIELLSRDRPNAPLVLPDLPFEVAIPSTAASDANPETLRATITRAMGDQLYNEGSGAVRDEAGESHLDYTEPVRWTINMLGDGAHAFWTLVLIIAGLSLLALCAGMIWTRQSPLMAIAAGGAIAALLSLVAWLGMQALGSAMSGAIDKEIALVLRDGAWIGLRNGLAVVAMGLAAVFVFDNLFPRPEANWDDWDEYEEGEEEFQAPMRPPPY